MQFTVPQFIESEAKIVGSLTFKQLLFIAVPGGICFFLYFTFGKTNFFVFIILAAILMIGGLAFAFLKIGGQPLPFFLINFLKFNISQKVYLWAKKEVAIVLKKEPIKKIEEKKEEKRVSIKTTKDSQLKKLKTFIETKPIS